MVENRLEGKVAAIIDAYTLCINIGKNKGVKEGMSFEVVEPIKEIKDPDTKEVLGKLEIKKAEVVVTQVFDKMAVAEAKETESIITLPSLIRIRALPVDLSQVPRVIKHIKVGDLVRQIVST